MPQPFIPDAVFCDMDGLLLDTERLGQGIFYRIAGRYGITDAEAIFPQLMGLRGDAHQAVLRRLLPPEIDSVAVEAEWKAEFAASLRQHIPIKPHAPDMLKWLKNNAIPTALVTSTSRGEAAALMHRANLFDYFTAIIGGDEVTQGKPDPDIYRLALDRLGQTPKHCLALEDSVNGVRAAHSAGLRVIQVVDILPPDEDLLALKHEVVDSLTHLAQYLDWDFI